MNIERVRELESLISPEEALEFALLKNNDDDIREFFQDSGREEILQDLSDCDPEEMLGTAIENISDELLKSLLEDYGYQPIPQESKRTTA